MSRFVRLLWPVLYLFSPVPALLLYFHRGWYTIADPWSIAAVLGIFGYIYLLNQFISAARLRYFDRIYGQDRILRFHGIMAGVALVLVFTHRTIRERLISGEDLQVRWRGTVSMLLEDLQVPLGGVALLLFVVVSAITLLFMVAKPFGRFAIIRTMRRWMERRLRWRYHHFRIFHNLTAIAMLAALLHVMLASSTRGYPLRIATMAGWYTVAMACYLHHKIVRPRRERRQPFTVAAVERETENVVTIRLRSAAQTTATQIGRRNKIGRNGKIVTIGGRRRGYRDWRRGRVAGQFAYVRFLSGAINREEHPFTISTAPNGHPVTVNGHPADSATEGAISLGITVKQSGTWTESLAAVAVGDRVALSGPFGCFSHRLVSATASVVMIAGGIGITPFLSMLDDMRTGDSFRPVRLIWSVRQRRDLFRVDWVRELESTLGDCRVEIIVTGDPEWRGHSQRCDIQLIDRMLPRKYWRSTHFFVCGPDGMSRSITQQLHREGARRSTLHYEDFAF